MFRPTQTAPIALTAVSIVLGSALTVALIVVALLNAVEPEVLEVIGARTSEHSGLMFFTAVFIFVAAIRPLAGGVVLLIMAGLVFQLLPIIAAIAVLFAGLSFLRAWLSRRFLADRI